MWFWPSYHQFCVTVSVVNVLTDVTHVFVLQMRSRSPLKLCPMSSSTPHQNASWKMVIWCKYNYLWLLWVGKRSVSTHTCILLCEQLTNTHACMHACTHTYTHTHSHTPRCTHTCIRTTVCKHTKAWVGTHTHTHHVHSHIKTIYM